jgi:hypothetical protein
LNLDSAFSLLSGPSTSTSPTATASAAPLDKDKGREAAAILIRRFWKSYITRRKLALGVASAFPAIQNFLAICSYLASAEFDAFMTVLQSDKVQSHVKVMLAAIPKTLDLRKKDQHGRSSRTFLSFLPILHHPHQVFRYSAEMFATLVYIAHGSNPSATPHTPPPCTARSS